MKFQHIVAAAFARPHLAPSSIIAAGLLAFAGLAALPAGQANAAPTEVTALKAILERNAALPAAPLLHEDDFNRPSRLREVRLAPDGTRVAFLNVDGDKANLALLDTATGATTPLLPVSSRARLHWSGDSKVLFVVTHEGVATVAVKDAVSGKTTAFNRERGQQFAGVDYAMPRHVLIHEHDPASKQHRLLRLGADGASEVLYEGMARADGFLFDQQGRLRLLRTRDDDFNQIVSRWEGGKLIETTRCRPFHACELIALSPDQRQVFMRVNHQGDRKSLVALDIAGGRQRVAHADPGAMSDLGEVVLSTSSGQALFAAYDMPRRHNHGLTPEARRAAQAIGKRFPETNISIEASEPARHWLLSERGARLSHTRYWLYDTGRGSFRQILEDQRAQSLPLDEQQLGGKVALRYRASDGVMVHGYLSLPPGKKAASLPMLTMIHGGPWSDVNSEYSGMVQMLVNRGYAVFQPNFRASTGYGERYMVAPGADFGNGRVQADIIDGVRWLLAQGVGDPERQAVMGASFGGYSTLLALTHTPDLFQFGMAMQPPPDFSRTLKIAAGAPGAPGDAPFGMSLKEMGIHVDDAAQMKRIAQEAPLAHADKLRRPLLIVAGGKDNMVEIGAVTDYAARLQGQGTPVSLLVDPDEGHHTRRPMARMAQQHLMLRMLRQHLGGPDVPAPAPELDAYLKQNMKVNGALEI